MSTTSYDPVIGVGITMTDAAIEHVQRQLAKRGSGIGIRVGVKTVGCSGLAYVIDFIDAVEEDDMVFEITDGLRVAVTPQSYEIVKGTRLDYKKSGVNEGFEFNNPNVKETCGCGESFSV